MVIDLAKSTYLNCKVVGQKSYLDMCVGALSCLHSYLMLFSLHNFDDHVIWCHNIGDTQPRKPRYFLNQLNTH